MKIAVKHHMAGSVMLGTGGSEYVAIESAIGLSKHGFNSCIDSIALRYFSKKDKTILSRIMRFYGIPESDHPYLRICGEKTDDYVTLNVSGDILSGFGHIVYFHFPSHLKPEIYYPGLPFHMRFPSYLYYIVNRFGTRALVKRALVLLANSTSTARYIRLSLGKTPYVLPPPVNTDDIYSLPRNPYEDRKDIVLTVSRISYEKQPLNILYVARALKELGLRGWKALMVGSRGRHTDEIIEKIYGIASRYGLEKYIEFEAGVSRKKLVELYRNAKIYIHLTEKEHFGISIIEAMAAGTPAIIPRNSGAWIDIGGRDSTILFPYDSYEALLNAIRRLAFDKTEWEKRSVIVRQRSRDYSRSRFHNDMSKYVRYVIDKLSDHG